MRLPRIIVAGMLAGDPFQGGATWAVLQYVLGLQDLGHDVVVVDPLPPGPVATEVRTYFDAVCGRFDLVGRAALVPRDGAPYGMTDRQLARSIEQADVLINLSGRWRDGPVTGVPVRVYVDLDPGFTQTWHAQGADVGLDGHTHHVTVGAGVASGSSPLPTAGVRWNHTLPPVVLRHWPVAGPVPDRRLTTVANWRSYGSIHHEGVHLGQKAHAFRSLEEVPAGSPLPIEIALSIDPGDDADRRRLVTAGWRLVDPVQVAGDPDRYRAYVQSSWAELGVAKSGYVAGRTGWVSDRTACYLASGRPVIVQDSGFGDLLPVGDGIVLFDDGVSALAAITEVDADYERHRAAARGIAEEHLDARRVLRRLMHHVAA